MKISVIGFLIWIVAGVVWGFKGICFLMEKDIEMFTIAQIAGTDWISSISWEKGQEWALVLSETYLWYILLAIGGVFLVIGMFKKQ